MVNKMSVTDTTLEKGLSGAWVVHGNGLLGMIVAIYDHEPYAHMLPMQKVFSDIQTTFTSDGRHPHVDISIANVLEDARKYTESGSILSFRIQRDLDDEWSH